MVFAQGAVLSFYITKEYKILARPQRTHVDEAINLHPHQFKKSATLLTYFHVHMKLLRINYF